MASLWQRKKNGIWCVTYRENGRQKVRSLQTTNKREAKKLMRDIENVLDERGRVSLEVSATPPKNPINPKIDDFWKAFNQWAMENRSNKTVQEYENWFKQIRAFSRAERLGDIDSRCGEDFKRSLAKQGRRTPKGVGLKKRSINNGIRCLKSIWNNGTRLGLYNGSNPFDDVEPYRIPKQLDRDYLDTEQIDTLLCAAKEYKDQETFRAMERDNIYLAVALMALAGLRKREVSFARWEWIDWDEKIIVVDSHEEFTTKNGRARVISINSKLGEILEGYRREKGYILESTRQNTNKTEYRLDFKKGFKKVCDMADIQTNPHALRHSFASRHAVAGTSLHVIAGWLGHSTTWMTQQYAHFQKTYNDAAENI
ncbi:site-specific integrase [bacterium AH-315-P07]|nr:site-specific integrase [bacterium AH-315-P07]